MAACHKSLAQPAGTAEQGLPLIAATQCLGGGGKSKGYSHPHHPCKPAGHEGRASKAFSWHQEKHMEPFSTQAGTRGDREDRRLPTSVSDNLLQWFLQAPSELRWCCWKVMACLCPA